nr:uncharacterized protein LOC109155304 [Ipomoea batatas]
METVEVAGLEMVVVHMMESKMAEVEMMAGEMPVIRGVVETVIRGVVETERWQGDVEDVDAELDFYLQLLTHSDVCTRKITKLFQERTDPNGYAQAQLSDDTIKFYWEEFKEEKLDRRPSYFELFKHTHTKKHDDQTFIAEKDKQIHEKVALQREELTQKGEEVDESQLYYDAVGGHDKKRRIYRLGSYGTFIRGPINANTSDNITSTSQPSDNANSAKMQDEIENLKASLVLMQQRLDDIESERAGTSSSPSSYPNST